MDCVNVSHIAFCVRDIDESLKFYRDIVGMIVDFDRVQDTTGGGLPAIYAHSRNNRRQVRLRFAKDAYPHFIMTTHPDDVVDGEPLVREGRALADGAARTLLPLRGLPHRH